MSSFLVMIADTLDRFTPGAMGWAVYGLVGFLMIAVLSFTAANQVRTFFARKPPIDEDLARQSKAVEELKLELSCLTPNEKFDKLAESLSGFASLKQLAALEVAMDQQIKDVRRSSHDFGHETRNDLGARILRIEEASIARGERLAQSETRIENCMNCIDTIFERLEKRDERIAQQIIDLVKRGKGAP